MEIIQSILTNNPCYKEKRKIVVKGLMLHSVGCSQPSAEVFVRKWNSAEASRACVHAFVDGNTGKVYQTLPWNHRAWHGGGESNNCYIGVEMCEPACIKYTGGSNFVCTDSKKALEVVRRTYKTSVELFAFLCKKFHLNPLEDGVIISHKEGHDRGIASGHGDPDHLWNGTNCGYTMDGFRRDVAVMVGIAQHKPESKVQTVEVGKNEKACTESVRVGAVIKLSADAVYYEGKKMPDWVKQESWIVKSVNGDRIVLGRNVSGSHEINSPVNRKYILVNSDKGKTRQQEKSKSVSVNVSSIRQGEMKISDRGVELVAKYEGCRLEAYKCPAGVWTIGYGHTAGVKQGDKLVSMEAAKSMLKQDLEKYGNYVNSCVKNGMITFPLNQNQFDALTSFCYNCGEGNLQNLVTGRNAATIAEKMLLYNKGGRRVLPGLVRRRTEERALFLS